MVHIVTPKKSLVKNISEDWQITAEGLQGNVTIVSKEGTIRIAATNCPKKICKRSRITREGGTIICLPNQVYIYKAGVIDGITR